MKLEQERISPDDEDQRECHRAAAMERAIDRADYLRDERRDREMEERESARESRKPQDGRICQCEDAPCCGCYDL